MKKRILSLLLALMMVVLLLPVTALAAETGIDTSALDMEYYGRYRDKGYSISVYNCGEYISDGADGGLDVNKAFEEVTGIRSLRLHDLPYDRRGDAAKAGYVQYPQPEKHR